MLHLRSSSLPPIFYCTLTRLENLGKILEHVLVCPSAAVLNFRPHSSYPLACIYHETVCNIRVKTYVCRFSRLLFETVENMTTSAICQSKTLRTSGVSTFFLFSLFSLFTENDEKAKTITWGRMSLTITNEIPRSVRSLYLHRALAITLGAPCVPTWTILKVIEDLGLYKLVAIVLCRVFIAWPWVKNFLKNRDQAWAALPRDSGAPADS